MGRAACEAAYRHEKFLSGSVGAGTGATIGKLGGMKSGLGFYAVKLGDLKLAALVVVNATGDVFDERNGKKIASMTLNPSELFLTAI